MKNLIRVIFILIGVFIGHANVLTAQCGFTTGEGCPNTDYENYGVGSSIPGTLEYDNFVSVFHATIARTYDGTFKCWGENIGSNGATHITSPQVINSTNYPGLTGTPLKATAGSNFASTGQFILLTTTGLFAWGNAGNVLSTTIKSTNTFSKLTINGETDGLPIGIDPVDVKMLQATYQTLVLTTCSGSVYVLSQAGNARGNGNTGDSNTWYQVTTSDAGNPPLTNIVAARAIHNTVYALASDNTIWTWGNGSYLGDTNASAIRTRATIMTHPNTSETIKMIGITGISGAARSYFVVMTNGKLYALGNNSNRQLGDWTTIERLIWVRSKYTSTSGPDIDNVKWLSAQEHDASFGSVNIINADSTQFAWGQNAGPGMIGSTTDPGYPQIPQGVLATDKIIAVETGGHTSMNIKKCTSTFGYVGHRTNGSMGDGTTGSAFQNSYTYVTAAIDLCGASQATISLSVSANASGNFCTGEIVSLTGTPAGGTFLLLSGPGNLVGTTLTFTGTAGTVVVQYTVNNSCGIPVSTSINIPVAISPDAGPNQSFCGIAGSVNMSATGAGVWSLASGNPGTATIVTPSSANTEVNSFSAFGTYKLYYTNAGSCVDSAFVMVNNCLPSWTLQKTSTTVPNNYDQVGDVLTYNIEITNTGNVSISSVVVTDPTATSGPTYVSGDLGVSGTMEVGEVWNYTASRTVNQANLDAGSYANTASVTGVPVGGILSPASDMETIPAIQNPSIQIIKTGTYVDNAPVGIYNAGDQITYEFSVENTGNVTLTNVTVSDPQVTITGSPIASLAPGAINTVAYTATKTLTQIDIDNGLFTNTATVTGTPPTGPNVTDTDDDTQNFIQNPSVQIIKTGTYVDNAPVGIHNAGDQITYAFSVENTGNVTLTNVTVSDLQVTVTGSPIASLAPGAINTVAYTATKTLTQTDIDNGVFTNTATVTGTPPIGPNVTDTDDDTQNFIQNASIQIIKTGTYVDNAPVGIYNAGDQITYEFSVENTGNVTLTNVTVSDAQVTITGSPIASLTPGAINTVAYTATKTLTQTDIDNGLFTNTATVTGTPPSGPNVTDTDDDTQNFTQTPAIALTKASNLDLGVNGISNPGDIITYTYVIHNTGNVTLSNVVISEQSTSFTGTGILPLPVYSSSSLGSVEGILQVGESATYTAPYAITQADINEGLIYNQAMTEGQSPANVDVNDLSDSNNVGDPNETGNAGDLDENDATGTYIPQTPIIGISKTISSGPVNNNDGTYSLTYSIGVENMGNTTLYFAQVVEDLNQTFGGATNYSVVNVSSGDFTVNPNFDGNTDTNLLTGADNLLVSGSGTVTLSLTVTPGANLGPYSNTAVATSEAPSGIPVTDDSQNGTDVDPDNNDDPTDNDDPTSVTFTENPSIGIAKAITNGPSNNNDGTYTLTYTMLVENTGDVLLDNVQVVENLNTTFGGATSYTVNSINSTDFTVNNNFNGNSDINLLDGTNNLIYQGSGSITLTVTITPGSNLGAYNNTAVANGTSPANQSVTDDSQNGTDVDPDNNDDPTDNDDPTSITFTENPSIGIAKAITNGPINNNDGTYTLTYTMLVENTGDVLLNNLQVVENLNTTFAGATSYTVNSISSTDFTVNNNFNGNSDINLLSSTDNLIYQGSGSITMTVTIIPGFNLGAYNNTAVANGTSPASQTVTDYSQDGTEVDPDNNDDPTDNDDPTSVTFTENPSIGIAKAITNGPINNNDGTYTLTYTVLVENTGDVLLNNLQVVENLNTTFAGATSYTVNSISSTDFTVNNNFNGNSDINLLSGTDNLIYQGSGSITLTVTITPGSNLGAYNNTAVTNGTSPANLSVTDDSQDGADVDPDNNNDPTDNDEPTPVSFTESPGISVVKGSSLALGTDAIATVGDIITYTYVATNTGDVTLQNVTIDEQIGAFTGNGILPVPVFVNASMGSSAGTILSGESATYTATYALTQTDIDAGIVHNQVLVAGLSPSGATVSDLSDSSNPGDINETGNVGDADENDATSTIITQTPAIALTKASNLDLGVNGISNPGDIITYTYVVYNKGNVTLNNVNISEQSSSFTGTGILPLPVFSSSSLGSVEGILQVGESAIYTAPYAITQADINEGLIYNQAMTEGQSPANVDVNDLSDSNNVGDPNETGNPGDLDENDATGTYIPQTPIIGISKTISSGPVNNNDGTYSLTYSIGVENMGNTTLYFVQVVEDLNQTFGGATNYSVVNVSSGDFTLNPNFDGNTDTNLLTGADNLLVSGSGTITLSLTVTPGANLGPYSNTAVATSEAPSGMPVTDDSQNGTDVDPDNNDDPTDNDEPTSITFTENPSIGIAKAITNGPINNNDGTYTLIYTMLVENTGDVLLNNLQVAENLNTTFGGATSYTVNSISSIDFTVNNNFNGNSDFNLLSGTDNLIYQGSGSITLTVTITPGSNLGAYNNTAVANGNSPASQTVTDNSQNGTDVDPDNNDDPTDNNDPTSVIFTENPSIGIAKAITNGPINNNDGTYTLTYTMLVENTGDVLLNNVQVVENLNTTFAGATSYTVDNISSTDFTVNNNFNGNSDINLLDGTDNLIYQGSGSITLIVTITPGSNLGAYNNTAVANGTSPANQSVTDDSQNGTDVDPDNNDDPTDNDDPTSITFTENPSIGIAKAITNGPSNNNDGTYTLTYTMLVENTGDVLLNNVQVVENLNTTFAGATSYTVDNISSIDFTVNNNFNGNSDINLLSGTDNLIYQGSGSITLTVTVTPGSNLGAYNNTAVANGTSPANQSVTDDSQNGTDVDPDNNNDPTDNNDPTSITFTENPSIGIAKAITNGPINNNDGTYTLTYTMLVENTGDVLLNNLQVVENLNTTFAGATSYTVNSISSTDFTVNNNFNGNSDINLLDGTNNLIYQGSGSITLTVTITPGSNLGAYNNTAVANGTSPANQSVTDDSQDGTEVDPDNNDDPTDNDDPTSVTFTENPNIGISKALTNGPINKGNQTYDLEFTMILQNTGDVPLSNIQVIDDLALTFGAAESFTINSVTTSANLTVNPLYNGTTNIQLLSGNDGLAYNETGTITLSVNLRPGINITPFENVAIVNGESPSGALVSDDSQDGDDIDPDNDNNPSNNGDPTPILIPAVAVLKDLTSSVLLPDGDVRLTFDLLVKNIGNVTMTNLILEDNLLMSSAFSSTPDFVVSLTNLSANIPPSANISYNGVSDINLITGNSNLAPAQEFRIALSFDVNPVLFSQLNNDFKKNQAVVFGTPRDQNGNVLINKSTASFYTPREVFDASDDISGLVLGNIFDTNNGANGDGLGLNPYDNPTPITMPSSIKVLKAISATNPPVQLLNGNYRVTYDFDVINNGGQVLQSIQLEDDIAAQYGCAFIGNASVPLISLSNNSNLSVLPTVNNLFAGAGSEINMLLGDGILYPGDTIHLTTSLEIDPSCINPASPLENQATVFAIDETESSVNDLSDDVTDMNDDGLTDYPGLGLDDPTPLEIPSINVVKSLTNIKNANSNIPGNKDVTYRFTIQNTGNTNLGGIDLIDQLQSQLAPVWVGITTMPNIVLSTASVTPILNPNFNGGSQANMFNGTSGNLHPGQFVTVQLTIEIDPNKDNTYPQLTNQATTNADVILGNGIQIMVTDASDDGVNPKGINPNYLGDTGTSNDPTPLIVPAISTIKNVVSYQNALSGIEGHYDVVMNISVKNIGNVNLTNISLLDTIELTKYVGPYFVGLAPTTSPNIVNSNLTQNPTLNNAFNGRLANSNIFDGNSGLMAPGQAFTVQLRIELDATLPGLPDSLWNRVSAYGDAAQNDGSLYYLVSDGDPITTSDDSDAGYDHEGTNSNQPEDLGTSNDKTLIEVLGEIGDFVWNDLDGDGIQDVGEPGLSNVLVGLYDCNDQFIRSVTTDANGAFALTNVLKGQYKLKFDFSNLGNGYAFTLPNVGNDALNSDVNADGFTNCFTLNAGERSDDIDAGLVRLANIGKFVWDDLNGDGLQSSSEPGISGVQVKIFLADGTLVDSTVTSSNGQYEFIGLYPSNYYLTFTTPDGYSFTFANSGSNDAVDSDVNGANGLGTTSVFTLLPGVTINTLNAGMYRCIPIGDLVWYDLNKNDVWDSNENGINGLPVNLWRNVGGTWIIWDTKFTGFKPNSPSADGYFNFCAPPGQYYIEVIIPQLGLVRARPNIGNNEEIDSDLTNAFGVGTSASFTVTSGQQKNDLGAGYYPMAIAGNLVWQDDNQNGLQDDEEPKVAGIKVQAYDANTHLVVAEAITDEEGKYTLDYLERADIYIKFDVPAGFSPTIARATDDTMDSDVDHSYGPNTTRIFAMESGMVNENIDLGITFGVLPVEWFDVNASRVNNTHIVSWRTAKEVNVAYYVVERRFADETVFTEIPGKVTVNGNTNAIQAYSLIDQDVALSGVYIYRVKQVDFDGKYTYSKLVSVQNQGEDIITLYPNPAKGEANLEISLTKDGEVSVEIFDNTSKLVKVVATEQQQLQGVKSYPLNLQDMSAGIYNLKISINGVVTHKKLIRIE